MRKDPRDWGVSEGVVAEECRRVLEARSSFLGRVWAAARAAWRCARIAAKARW